MTSTIKSFYENNSTIVDRLFSILGISGSIALFISLTNYFPEWQQPIYNLKLEDLFYVFVAILPIVMLTKILNSRSTIPLYAKLISAFFIMMSIGGTFYLISRFFKN